MEHQIKTWPGPFAAVLDGSKTYEIRKADRRFLLGDYLLLREWLPESSRYTGRELRALVVHRTMPGEWGLPADVCVMGIKVMP